MSSRFLPHSRFLLGRKPRPKSTAPREPHTELINKEFDATSNEEISAISAEIGATGARRPASE